MSQDELPPRAQQSNTEEGTASDNTSVPHGKRRLIVGLLAVAALLAVIALLAGAYAWYRAASQPKNETLKVGVLMAFTGGSSNMGYGTMKGIQLAKKQLGAENIELVQADSECDPGKAKTAMERLLRGDVVAVIGDGCSSASVAALPLANNNKIPMVSPSASSATLTIPNDYFFRVVPNDNYQARYMAEAMEDRGIKNVAVFYTNEPYGSAMAKSFQERFETIGGKVVATTFAEPDVIDLTTQMNELKNANPEAVFIAPNSLITATAAIKVAREVGLTVPLFGGDIFYDRTLIRNAPDAAEGLTITSFPTGSSTFKQMLVNEYRVSEQLYAAPQAYDAFHAIYLAIQKGARTGEEIRNTLPSVSFQGMSAKISFDQNGEEPGDNYVYDVLQVKDGAFSLVDR